MTVRGIHHITCVSGDAQRTVDFYTQTLGLSLVKQTVNFDDPGAYHLYFGDDEARPGTLITFFEWQQMRPGHEGIGATHHLAFSTEDEQSQLQWKRWLTERGVPVSGPYDRVYFKSIYFKDPDGLIIEIATRGPGWTVDEPADQLGQQVKPPPSELTVRNRDEATIEAMTWPEPVERISPRMRLDGLHHITAIASNAERTERFYTETLGMRLVKRTLNFDNPTSPHLYFGVGDGAPGTIITYFAYRPTEMPWGQLGTGMTHHFALEVADEDEQREYRERLLAAGVPTSEIVDRQYFKSIYFQDPDGHILEIATSGPGFFVDEDRGNLGQSLKLPSQLEPRRAEIEAKLTPLRVSSRG